MEAVNLAVNTEAGWISQGGKGGDVPGERTQQTRSRGSLTSRHLKPFPVPTDFLPSNHLP